MKKIILILVLFTSALCSAQKIKADLIKYKELTTAERDAFTVPLGEHWKIYNTTTSQFEYWNGSTWASLGSGGGGATNLTYTASPINGLVNSDTGTNATIPLADGTNAGLISPSEKALVASALQVEVDGSVTNEIQTIDVSQLTGTNLEISLSSDGEATKVIDLSSLQDGTGTDDQTGAEVLLTGYTKAITASAVAATDNVNEAIGKLEKSLEDATSGGVTSVAGKTGVVTLVEADITDLSHSTEFSETLQYTGTRLGGDLVTAIGDYDAVGNGTYFSINDATGKFYFEGELSVNNDIYAHGKFRAWNALDTFTASFGANTLTANRDLLAPDASGTIALTSDLVGIGHTIQENGVDQTQRAKLNFKGAVTVDDNLGNTSTDVTFQVTGGFAANQGYETLTATGGETSWVLSETPTPSTNNQLYIGGSADTAFTLLGTSQYSLTGNTLTLSGAAIPSAGDILKFYYAKGTTATVVGTSVATAVPSQVIDLNNQGGVVFYTPEYNATYTTANLAARGWASVAITTTGQTVFPTITGATLITGAAFEADTLFDMVVSTKDGTNVKYFFVKAQ